MPRQAPAALDQRPTDGDLLPAGRARDQARSGHGGSSRPRQTSRAAFAAAGGMLVPVAIYASLNWQDPVRTRGWAVRAATDIAFALGALALFGARVPLGLKVFLMTLAVLDDLVAIVIIALFYSADLSMTALAGGRGRDRACPAQPLRRDPHRGLHTGRRAALAERAQSAYTPRSPVSSQRSAYRPGTRAIRSARRSVRSALAAPVGCVRDPAGLCLRERGRASRRSSFADLLEPIPLGIVLGLVVGKQLGVFVFAAAAIRLRLARPPEGVDLQRSTAWRCSAGSASP